MIGFEPMNFVANLKYMGTGLLCIFIVICVIILATVLVNKLFSEGVGKKVDAIFDRILFGKNKEK